MTIREFSARIARRWDIRRSVARIHLSRTMTVMLAMLEVVLVLATLALVVVKTSALVFTTSVVELTTTVPLQLLPVERTAGVVAEVVLPAGKLFTGQYPIDFHSCDR